MLEGGEQAQATDLSPRRLEDLRCECVELSINCCSLQGQVCLFMQFVRLSSQIDSLTRSRPALGDERLTHPDTLRSHPPEKHISLLVCCKPDNK